MPAQLGTVIAGQAAAGVKDGVKAGVEDGVKEELRGAITPGKAKKTGFIVGTAVWVILMGIVQRRWRLRRLEEKLEIVVQELAAKP